MLLSCTSSNQIKTRLSLCVIYTEALKGHTTAKPKGEKDTTEKTSKMCTKSLERTLRIKLKTEKKEV